MCKNLFLRDKKKQQHVVVTALAETNADLKHLGELLAVKNLRLAREEVLHEKLGLQSGAVTPLSCIWCASRARGAGEPSLTARVRQRSRAHDPVCVGQGHD